MNMHEDTKLFDDVLADLSLRSAPNHGSVRGAAIERYRGAPSEGPNAASTQHREGGSQSAVKPVSPLPKYILHRVIERMRNLDTKLSLEVLAKESGYSRVHFVRMFRAATGYPPHSYLLKLRVDRVRELQATSTLSLTEIAIECGFSSHSHLSRVFRQVMGATPSEYRRSLQRLNLNP